MRLGRVLVMNDVSATFVLFRQLLGGDVSYHGGTLTPHWNIHIYMMWILDLIDIVHSELRGPLQSA